MSHLTSGALVDPRPYEMTVNLLDLVLVLERFRPGTHADLESEKPLSDMKGTQLAWSWYKLLVRRSCPWDMGYRVLDNFIILQ